MGNIKTLNETVWEHRADRVFVDKWLDNFLADTAEQKSERLHALFLLSQFMYFANRQMRELLRALYRDVYKYPIIECLRRQHNDTTDVAFLGGAFLVERSKTRFLGMGNPSESGCHLLYYFRQENCLPKELFIHGYQVFVRYGATEPPRLRFPQVTRYVFLDDFCGSGEQAKQYSEDILKDLKRIERNIHVAYYVLFATSGGLKVIREHTLFDDVQCIFELDDTYRCFGNKSLYFLEPHPSVDKKFAETMCTKYGSNLMPAHPLGFGNCQLLIGFDHNTPDNTLPIIWYDEPGEFQWTPIFKRYPKDYG
jgi:hypothetical protein